MVKVLLIKVIDGKSDLKLLPIEREKEFRFREKRFEMRQ